ncbi:MAG: amino acid ABC transporter permease [Treponema sp.]|nr:amino acid ABC transporter permease [Treponema sp.]
MGINTEFFVRTFFITLKAIPVTLNITVVSFLLAVLPAFAIAFARLKKIKAIAYPGTVYVSIMRGTPMVLQILVMYSLLPSFLNMIFTKLNLNIKVFDVNPIVYAYVVFTLNTIATMSEVFRSALQTVNKGQHEAALSIGLSSFQSYRRIVIPQALVSAVPNLCTLTVTLIKNTSLAFMMAVKDITAVAKIEASFGYNYVEAYLDVFVVYIIVCSVVQLLFHFIEKQLRNSTTGGQKKRLFAHIMVLFARG